MKSQREIELKFRVHGFFEVPEMVGLDGIASVEPLDVRNQTSTYFDTADFRLFRWGITLRRRVGGPDDGWHIKVAVPQGETGEREELHFASHGEEEVPERIADLLLGITRGAALKAVATLQTERKPILLKNDEGVAVAELVDDTVSVLKDDAVIERFREIEVELLDGSTRVLIPVATALENAGALAGSVSKLGQALGPHITGGPEIVEPVPVMPTDPASMAVLNHIRRHARALITSDMRVRRHDPEGVHDLRVAARRLRSGLQVFKDLLPEQPAATIREDLKWLATQFSVLRDTDVLIARLKADAASLPGPYAQQAIPVVLYGLEESTEQARNDAEEVLRSPRYVKLIDDLIAFANAAEFNEIALEPCFKVLPPLARKSWKKLKSDVAALTIDGESRTWHEARIQAKRARYAAELLVPVFGKEARVLVKSLTKVTELLGAHQDCTSAADRLHSMVRGISSPEVLYGMGLIAGRELGTEMALRHQFVHIWPQVLEVHKQSQLR